MHAVLLLSCLVTIVNQALGELEYYPEYRKPGAISKWSNGVEVPTDYELQQLVDFLRKRPRLQDVPPPYVLPNRDQDMLQEFTYQFPKYPATAGVAQPFAVDPSDPRYYLDLDDDIRPEPKTTTKISRPNKKDDELERTEDQTVRGESRSKLRNGDFDTNNGHYYRRGDSPRWTDEDNVRKIKIVSGQATEDRKPIAGIYIIAIVAGVSAAATVGLIAFAFGWYK